MARDAQAVKFIHVLMSDGKRRRAERIFGAALETVRRKVDGKATTEEILSSVIEKLRPEITIQLRGAGGVQYEVPVPVPAWLGRLLAIREVVEKACKLPGRGMADRLAKEILSVYRNEST
jgi:ribosomal protein S7